MFYLTTKYNVETVRFGFRAPGGEERGRRKTTQKKYVGGRASTFETIRALIACRRDVLFEIIWN